ncbi:MAG TPA: response regulator transcription factor [Rubrobacteraceae bacterium]|nr:response regulator transcription factor [Rubrobacteraceae bacterium]
MKRVLLVEDHGSFRRALAMFLERKTDLKVVGEAGSVAEGLRLAREGARFDVAVIDLGLPDGDGVVLIRELRRHQPDASILVLSVSLERDHLARAREAGANEVLGKEARPEKLVATVKRLAGA